MNNSSDMTRREAFDATLLSSSRLPIVLLMAMYEEVDFAFLKKELGMSDGNLGANLLKLEQEGVVSCKKCFLKRKPRSVYTITHQGKKRLRRLIEVLKAVEPHMA